MRTPPGSSFRPASASFTLIEMLVAVTVLALLMLLIAQLTGAASGVSDITNRHADATEEARQVLDRIGLDMAGMLNRPDVDAVFYNGTGNDAMFFYSRVPGYFDSTVNTNQQSPISLIGYRIAIDTNSNQPVLQRLSVGTSWSGTNAMSFLTVSTTTSTTGPVTNSGTTNNLTTIPGQWSDVVGSSSANYTNGTSTYWHTIGSQIFRLEICFQANDGTYTAQSGIMTNNAALIVAIAALDSKSRLMVNAGSFPRLITQLQDIDSTHLSDSPPQLMQQIWNNALGQSTFSTSASIPSAAASQIRVYQRYYPLNPTLQ